MTAIAFCFTDRVVVEGKVNTAAGVSAGIDMALRLAAMEAGEDEARALQLVTVLPRPAAAAHPGLGAGVADAAEFIAGRIAAHAGRGLATAEVPEPAAAGR